MSKGEGSYRGFVVRGSGMSQSQGGGPTFFRGLRKISVRPDGEATCRNPVVRPQKGVEGGGKLMSTRKKDGFGRPGGGVRKG